MYPAIIVVTNNANTLHIVPPSGAYNIPSENGKFMGLASIKGTKNPYRIIIPSIDPRTA
jgi:hypothetical protein